MAYTTIAKPNTYFNTKLYTGNGSTQSITGINFQPDFTWIKTRSFSDNYELYDAVRGVQKRIMSNSTGAEETRSQGLTAFGADGFTVGTNDGVNKNIETFVSWNWLANGAGSSNTDGTITSTVSANTTSGFSIVKWTGTGSGQSNVTIGHGLNATPKVIIFKQLDTGGWIVYHEVLGQNNFLTLNASDASTSATGICNPNSTNIVLPTSYLGTNSTAGMIAYCFAEKKGFSKMGSYVGNGSTDGTFVYTGFKPAFVLVKLSSGSQGWGLFDNKRIGYNPRNNLLIPSDIGAEYTSGFDVDILSNGFKARTIDALYNGSGSTYIYMAFAENPIVTTDGLPATAR